MHSKKIRSFTAVILSLFLLVSLSGCLDSGKDKDESYKKAMAYIEQSKDKEAIIELRNAIQADPKYADARYQLGLLYLKAGDIRKAFGELERAATLDPKNLDAKIKTAEFYLLSKKKDDARRSVDEVLVQDPENKDALAILANVELIEGNFEKALVAINKAIAQAPDEDRLFTIKGRIYALDKKFPEAEQALIKALEVDGNKVTNYAALVSLYMEWNKLDEAKKLLEKMAKAFPDSSQPYLQLASIYLREKDVASAEQYLNKALKVDPDNIKLKTNIASFYAKNGKLAQAEQLYNEAVQTAPEPLDVEAQLANFYFDVGKLDKAEALTKKVLAENDKNANALLVQAKFFLREKKYQEGLDIVNQLVGDYPKWGELYYVKAVAHRSLQDSKLAKEALLNAIKLSPDLSRAHGLLGFISLQEGDYQTAKKESAIALKLNPRDFQSALTLAKAVLFNKEYDTAERMFTELLEKVPENVEVLGSLGLTYLGQKNEAKAKQSFEDILKIQPGNSKALTFLLQLAEKSGVTSEELIKMTEGQIEKAPKSSELYVILANLYLGDKKPNEALTYYRKAQLLDPNNPQPYAMSALILTRQGKRDQAIAEYNDLLAKQPKALGAYMGLGSLYEQSGKGELARDTYKKALELNPEFAPAANNMAWLIAESENPDLGEALRLAMIAKGQKPDDVHIIDTLGWVHYKRGSYSLARNEFQQAVEKNESMPVLRYHLALALYGEGKKQEALEQLEKALDQKKPFAEQADAIEKLNAWRAE